MLVRFIKNLDVAFGNACRYFGTFLFCRHSFCGACQTLCEWVSGFPDSAFDFFPTSAHFLQGGGVMN